MLEGIKDGELVASAATVPAPVKAPARSAAVVSAAPAMEGATLVHGGNDTDPGQYLGNGGRGFSVRNVKALVADIFWQQGAMVLDPLLKFLCFGHIVKPTDGLF